MADFGPVSSTDFIFRCLRSGTHANDAGGWYVFFSSVLQFDMHKSRELGTCFGHNEHKCVHKQY